MIEPNIEIINKIKKSDCFYSAFAKARQKQAIQYYFTTTDLNLL
ncbi:hypothetical protein DDD_2359 [Nonlabens dokdonensis DSW-6]|uniref:Uncharacterized protein n=1 Tax=Nonlabens dokdonensis (strain DSM 17205 / KCTC 12402 / DSW-6) TaxID=592029 RepID=L7WC40_NONDD|nr:hypothetical protein DDD_2359 [Nonlabens dokdonensis DSW-6]